MKSVAWQYFDKLDAESAQCKLCENKAIILTKGGSTKGLISHLAAKHHVNIGSSSCGIGNSKATLKRPCNDTSEEVKLDEQQKCKKSKITEYFTKTDNNSLDAVVARMTSLDYFPFRVFITSNDLRLSMQARGFTLPKSEVTIHKIVMDYAVSAKERTKLYLNKKKIVGDRFACTLDEWSSKRNRRYLGVTLSTHDHVSINLGLLRISSMPADVCVVNVTKFLQEFGVNVPSDVICFSTDGASVMKKFGSLIGTEHQLCYAHGIHLAVCEVLYNDRVNFDGSYAYNSDSHDSSIESSDDENNDNNGVFLEINSNRKYLRKQHGYLIAEIKIVVSKVRKIVKLFKRSPLRNDILQHYVNSECGKQLCLILDCKTRWNSLAAMLDRFLTLICPIRKAANDINVDLELSDNDITLLNNVNSSLKPVELVVNTLCNRDCNILIAHTAVKFAVHELRQQSNNLFAQGLSASLTKKIHERENVDLLETFEFLLNGKLCNSLTSFNMIKCTIISLVKRLRLLEPNLTLNSKTDGPNSPSPNPKAHSSVCDTDKATMSERLLMQIEQLSSAQVNPIDNTSVILESNVAKEMDLFRTTGQKGDVLTKCFRALQAIHPTSVECERAFSVTGLFCGKLRTSLNDTTLSSLLFLRSFFKNSDNLDW